MSSCIPSIPYPRMAGVDLGLRRDLGLFSPDMAMGPRVSEVAGQSGGSPDSYGTGNNVPVQGHSMTLGSYKSFQVH